MCLILAATQLSGGDKRPENYKLTGIQPVEFSGQLELVVMWVDDKPLYIRFKKAPYIHEIHVLSSYLQICGLWSTHITTRS